MTPEMKGQPMPTEETRSAWGEIAAGYDEFVTPTHMWLANEGLRRAGLERGMRFLDVAAGSGALSIPAARAGAEVLATDLSPKMLERLEARARREGVKVRTRVMDGHALDLEDASFDMVGSQFGVMLFPDMPRGIREMARVTRPGGRVLMHVYGPPEEVEFITFFTRGIRAVLPDFPGLPKDPPPLPFQLQDPRRLEREFADVGLHDVRVETITETLEFGSGDQLWAWLANSNPISGALLAELGLDQDRIRAIRRTLTQLVSKRAGGTGRARLTNPIHIGIGTRR